MPNLSPTKPRLTNKFLKNSRSAPSRQNITLRNTDSPKNLDSNSVEIIKTNLFSIESLLSSEIKNSIKLDHQNGKGVEPGGSRVSARTLEVKSTNNGVLKTDSKNSRSMNTKINGAGVDDSTEAPPNKNRRSSTRKKSITTDNKLDEKVTNGFHDDSEVNGNIHTSNNSKTIGSTAQPTIKSYYSRDNFIDQLDSCSGWNAQFGINRRKRLPFIDKQSTGLVFSSLYKSNIEMKEIGEQSTKITSNNPDRDKISAYSRPYFKNQFLTSARRCPGMKQGQIYSYPRVEYKKRPKVSFNPKVPEYVVVDSNRQSDLFESLSDNYSTPITSSQSTNRSQKMTKSSKSLHQANSSLTSDLLDETSNSSIKESSRSTRRRASNQVTYMEEGLSDEEIIKSDEDDDEKDKDFVTWAEGYRNTRNKPGSKGRGRRGGGGKMRGKRNKDDDKTGLYMIDEDSRDQGFDSPADFPHSSTVCILFKKIYY